MTIIHSFRLFLIIVLLGMLLYLAAIIGGVIWYSLVRLTTRAWYQSRSEYEHRKRIKTNGF
jgi:hypothetical protein